MNMYNNTTPMGGYSSFLPLSGAVTETVLPSSVFNNHSLGNAVKSESGVTYNNNNNHHHHHHINNVVMTPTSRKRSRDNSNNYGYNNNINNDSFSFLGQDVSLQIQQQQLDIEHLIMQRVSLVHSFVVSYMFLNIGGVVVLSHLLISRTNASVVSIAVAES